MVITLTSLSQHQWAKVGKVILWVAVSTALALATAYIAKNPEWLATMPGWNILGVLLQQILTQEEESALENVPPELQQEIEKINPVATPGTTVTPSTPSVPGQS